MRHERFKMTPHAQSRRKAMKVGERLIFETLDHPEMVYPGNRPGGIHERKPPRTCYVRGDLLVIVQDNNDEIITVLWHRKENRD